MEFSKTDPWWTTDTYGTDSVVLLPDRLAGPHGVATVWCLPDGRTQPGWGLVGRDGKPGFMENYRRGKFDQRKTTHQYRQAGQPFAYIMRSVPLICVDVDGKNGGFSNMPQLGLLPPTLVETSKSGNGLHLFYRTDEEWDDVEGFAQFDDRIGLATGIDVRATGCVYHHKTQRWNRREIADLPPFLSEMLRAAKERRVLQRAALENIDDMDEVDVLMAQHTALEELKKPIPTGKRNNTLFAIGTQLKLAAIPDWEDKIIARAVQVGLSGDEAQKLAANIAAYGN